MAPRLDKRTEALLVFDITLLFSLSGEFPEVRDVSETSIDQLADACETSELDIEYKFQKKGGK